MIAAIGHSPIVMILYLVLYNLGYKTMGSREDVLNVVLAGVLGKARHGWTVWGQSTNMLESNKQPDIITQETGANPIIIETEFMPAATLEHDMENKLNQTDAEGRNVAAVIGVRIPIEIKKLNQTEIKHEIKTTDKLEYAALTPTRFPAQGWLKGTAFDVARMAQTLSVPHDKVDASVDMVISDIDDIANLISQSGSDVKSNIATVLHQAENMQTWKMAGLILTNAFIFHMRIAGESGIKNFMELRVVGIVPLASLLDSWDYILDKNYESIFKVARSILTYLPESPAGQTIERLVRTAGYIERMGMVQSSDMYGSLIQRMITDRKTLASFYTLPESAALLSMLVVPPVNADVYKNADSMLAIKCADFACGTGTLLTLLYKYLIQNYEINGGKMVEIHSMVMENCIYGADVLPSATHLTASSLANFYPKKLCNKTNIKDAWYGITDGVCNLGSLNFILDEVTFDKKGKNVHGKNMEVYYNPNIPSNFFDIIVMNPPFTGNTREGGKEGHAMFKSFETSKEDQKLMASVSTKIFKNTCSNGNAGYATNFLAVADKKIKPGGTLGFVLPSTIHYGSSWQKVRDMLALRYKNITVISIAYPTNKDMAFSADTGMNEIILIAQKVDKDVAKRIEDVELRIVMIDKSLKRVQKKKTRSRVHVKDVQRERKELVRFLDSVKESNRGKFVSLHERPESIILASELGKIISKESDLLTIDHHSRGGSPVMFGNKKYGTGLDCPVNRPWWFVGVFDPILVQYAYALTKGMLKLAQWQISYDIPMTTLGDNLGLSTRDIGQYVKTTGDVVTNTRSPFFITPLNGEHATRYALWRNACETQITMLVKPDCIVTEKTHASRERIDMVDSTATRVHINRLNTFPSQRMSVLYTSEKSFGGESLPNVIIDEKYEKAFTAWSNSTLGILCFWATSGRQQRGRGTHSRESLPDVPVIDFAKLRHGQLNKLTRIFDKYKKSQLLAIKDLYKDENRIALDSAILNVFGIEEPLDDLRIRLAREPSINGGSAASDLLER